MPAITWHSGRVFTPIRVGITLLVLGCGCVGPQSHSTVSTVGRLGHISTSGLAGSPTRVPSAIDVPRADADFPVASPPSAVEAWVVHTRACDQEMGSNPWPSMTVARLDDQGGPLHGSEPEALLSQMATRPSVILIHGNGYTYKESTTEAVKIRGQLEAIGGLPPETLFIVYDWPSERLRKSIEVDLNEKAKRSRVAGYHLARFLQAAPEGSKICLMGQSDGARVALNTLHLLSGAEVSPFQNEPGGRLTSARTDLRFRTVLLEAAVGHTWLNPGDRLGSALPMTESLLNLWNSGDYALAFYVFGSYTGAKPALGKVGLNSHDYKKLGPLKDRIEEINQHSLAGRSHTLFTQSLTYPGVADRIAAYTSWSDVSGGAGKRYSTRDLP